jgi:hypothetical protein
MQLIQHHSMGRTILMAVLGMIAGYIVLALASTLVQEVWLGGVSYRNSSRFVLILAGVFTPICAFLGGLVSALVATHGRWLAALLLSAVIATETTYLYVTGRVDGPLWFEAGAGASFIVAVCAATWMCGRLALRHRIARR